MSPKQRVSRVEHERTRSSEMWGFWNAPSRPDEAGDMDNGDVTIHVVGEVGVKHHADEVSDGGSSESHSSKERRGRRLGVQRPKKRPEARSGKGFLEPGEAREGRNREGIETREELGVDASWAEDGEYRSNRVLCDARPYGG